jgi:PAS domain S-box-containing protein
MAHVEDNGAPAGRAGAAMERALADSEARYRGLFTAMDEGFLLAEVLVDAEGRAVDLLYLEGNPAAMRMTGLEYAGRRLRAIDPGFEPYWLDIWEGVARTGVGQRLERYAAPLDAWFDFFVFRVGDPAARTVAVLFRDVTERKRRDAHAKFLASLQDDLSLDATADEILQAVGARLGAHLKLDACTFEDVHEDVADPSIDITHGWNAAGRSVAPGGFSVAARFGASLASMTRAGETIVVADTRTSPHAAAFARDGVGAVVAVPFHRRGVSRFLLAVTAAEPRAWRPDEIALVEEVTQRLFPRLERARAEKAVRASAARQAFLVRLGDVLRPLTDPVDIEETVCRLMGEELRADRAVYARIVWEAGREHFDLARNYCAPGVPPMLGRHPTAAFGVEPMEALRAGRPVAMSATTASAQFSHETRAAYAAIGVAAFIAVPLVRGGQWVAVFGVHQNEARDWRPDEIALVEETAPRAWAAVEYARSDAALRASEARQAFLFRLGDALRPLAEPATVQATAARFLGQHLGANQVHYGEVTDDAVVIHQGYGDGLPPMVGTFHHAREGWGARLLESYRAGQTAVCHDVEHDPTITPAEAAVIVGAGFHAYVAVPLVKEGEYVAVLAVHSVAPRAWSADEVALVEAAAERTWAAVERARSEAALRESETRLQIALEAADLGTWELSHAPGTTAARSLRHDQLFGYDTLQPWWDQSVAERHMLPEDVPVFRAAMARAWETGSIDVDLRIRRVDGSIRWIAPRGRTYYDATGKPVRMAGVVADITARREAEAAAERLRGEEERDRLRRQLSRAEEAERRRLARELHDQLGQHLTAFALGIAEARRLGAAGQPADARLAQLEELARMMTADARYLALELRPPELDDVGLESALATYAEQWSARYGVATEVTVTGDAATVPLPPDTGTAIYRIVQEALTNVAKHAAATHVSVLLDKPDGHVRLVVEDDGRGFDVAATTERVKAERRLGLGSMRERAALVGGTLEVEASDGGGTTVYVQVPLAQG